MRQVFSKIFIIRFYMQNTGFFLVLFLLLFGIVNIGESLFFHYSLMQAAAHAYLPLLALLGAWLLYGLKCIGFMLATLHHPANSFLVEAQASGDRKQIHLLLYCQLMLFMPALLYALITAAVAIHEGSILLAVLILLFLAFLSWGSVMLFKSRLSAHQQSVFDKLSLVWFKQTSPKAVHTLLLHLSFTRHKVALLIIKFISLLLLDSMVAVNQDSLKLESVCFFTLMIVAVHSLLPHYFVRFLEKELSLLRNMPYSLLRRINIYLIAYAAILLPELIFLLLHIRDTISVDTILSVWIFAISQLSFFTSLLYLPKMDVQRYPLVVMVIVVLSMLLLAGINIWMFGCALLFLSVLIFLWRYQRYERMGDGAD